MKLKELKALYKNMTVTLKDDDVLRRSIIYLSFVEATCESLVKGRIMQKLSKVVGGHDKVAPALTQPQMLQGLCELLDGYIYEPINADPQTKKEGYTTYFDSMLENYENGSVEAFLGQFPFLRTALGHLNTLFQENVCTACTRVLEDWTKLQRMFVGGGRSDPTLTQLTRIKASGSDFHKGGQQVLILTFSLSKPLKGKAEVSIVYKPSDLEVDCLIIGDSEAVNAAKPEESEFQNASLMEILNERIGNTQDRKLEKFPTYKILPINPGSQLQQHGKNPLSIRISYGYIEYLANEDAKKSWGYRIGKSDYKIYPDQKHKGAICTTFYTLLGQLAAVAGVFSFCDLHMQNLIVHRYLPYLIDLENSLTTQINSLADTEMIGDTGCVGGIVKQTDSLKVKNDDHIEETSTFEPEQNLLWESSHGPVNYGDYSDVAATALAATMELLRDAVGGLFQRPFENWFKRLERCIVRIVPLETGAFTAALRKSFREVARREDGSANLFKKSLGVEMAKDIKRQYDEWAKLRVKGVPTFLCLQSEYVIDDLTKFDIPVFYHRLGSVDVLDSRGEVVTVVKEIDVDGTAKPVWDQLGKRTTYFAAPPSNHVHYGQLSKLQDRDVLAERSKAFVRELTTDMAGSDARKISWEGKRKQGLSQ